MAKRPKKLRSTPKNPPLPSQNPRPKPTPKAGGIRPLAHPPSQPQFITIADAAARLSVSVETIWRWIAHGKLVVVRVGCRVLIPLGAFVPFLRMLPPAQP